MCLEIKKFTFKRKARKDIIVYKQISSYVIEDKTFYVTPYRQSEIKIGNTYTSEIKIFGLGVENALHSFANIVDCFDNSRYIDKTIYVNGNGYKTVTPVLVECVIPKGSSYYKGIFDGRFTSYASDKLIYKRILKFS